jgi:hypothetical protein
MLSKYIKCKAHLISVFKLWKRWVLEFIRVHTSFSNVNWKDDGGDVTNVQYKSSQNCHYESPLYNEYILIKNFLK